MTPKGYLPPEFYSGATGLTGRFNEGFLLRRLQIARAERTGELWQFAELLRVKGEL